jgi:hypothetical protein
MIDKKEIEQLRLQFVAVWDFIGRNGPRLFAEIAELERDRDYWKEACGQGDHGKVAAELVLLRNLEAADRRADENNCRKSLNQKTALQALEDFRSLVAPEPPQARQPKSRKKG